MCAWAGVTCNGLEVASLSITSNNLGDFPGNVLQNLSSLSVLQLWGNRLTGTISPRLAALTTMQLFDLASNNLTGTLPPELGAAWQSTLRLFNVANNQLSGTLPTEYGAWTSLTFFDVGYNATLQAHYRLPMSSGRQ